MVTIKKEVLEDLVDFKIRHLNEAINSILTKWNYTSSSAFLSDARDGTIIEAEDDAISLRQLIKNRNELKALKMS